MTKREIRSLGSGKVISEEITFMPKLKDGEDKCKNSLKRILKNNKDLKPYTDEVLADLYLILKVLRNPIKFASYLQDLDQDLGAKLSQKGCDLSEVEPQYLFKTSSFNLGNLFPLYFPGPPKIENIHVTGKLLYKALLENEKKHGINHENFSAKFIGIVEQDDAENFLRDVGLFSEYEQFENMILHGKFSHRIAFYVISKMIEKKELSFFKDLKQVVEVFTNAKSGEVIWDVLLDNIDDLGGMTNSNNVHAILMCFGSELKLPNISHLLYNNLLKQSALMMDRFRKNSAALSDESSCDEEDNLETRKAEERSEFNKFYTSEFVANILFPGSGYEKFTVQEVKVAKANLAKKYEPYNESGSIMIKKETNEEKLPQKMTIEEYIKYKLEKESNTPSDASASKLDPSKVNSKLIN